MESEKLVHHTVSISTRRINLYLCNLKSDTLKYTILLLFFPTLLTAQVKTRVDHVVSKDYQQQIRKLRGSIDPVDSVANARNTTYTLKGQFSPNVAIRRLKTTGDEIQISPSLSRYITLSGSYSGTIELQTHNRMPRLQETYAQGRSDNGSLQWRGPETGELFSYGPAVSSLEFDGNPYPYDQYGKLVPSGQGNGKAANIYTADIFRPALSHSHQMKIQSALHRYGHRTWTFNLKLAHEDKQFIIRENKGSSNSLSSDISTKIKWLTVKGTYMFSQEIRTTGNRNGILNRAYQNALLTPATFNNQQQVTLGEGQRSYSAEADNPWFLLRDNDNGYKQHEHNAALTLSLQTRKWQAGMIQSLNDKQENNIEQFRPGTSGWNAGMYTDRNKRDRLYMIQSNVVREIEYNNNHFKTKAQLHHIYGNANTRIAYLPENKTYNYQRTSQDLFLNMASTYTARGITIKLNAGNKAYISNTSSRNSFLLPALDLGFRFDDLPGDLVLDLSSSYHVVNSELQINKSLTYTNLLQYTPGQLFNYRPVTEVNGYSQLSPIQAKEWNGKFSLSYQNIYLDGNFYTKNISNDVLPIYENGQLQLKNMADMTTKGLELSIHLYNKSISRNINTNTTLSFFKYRTDVTKVREGYNYTPIAGFSSVYKTLAEGQPLGVIVGNAYKRDAAGNIVIGDDGFPLADQSPKVIGNTIPDFVIKASNTIFWKKVSVQTNLEWKKGGQAWNGTQAALDYYGRSATTGAERNTTGYVFQGVKQDGHVNDIPVAFYDPAKPVTSNRWTRNGLTGIAEEYIRRTDYIRLNTFNITYRINLKKSHQLIYLATYVQNILLWSPYKGADPGQLLYDQPNTTGLDYFNLPAVKTFGFNVTYQF